MTDEGQSVDADYFWLFSCISCPAHQKGMGITLINSLLKKNLMM